MEDSLRAKADWLRRDIGNAVSRNRGFVVRSDGRNVLQVSFKDGIAHATVLYPEGGTVQMRPAHLYAQAYRSCDMVLVSVSDGSVPEGHYAIASADIRTAGTKVLDWHDDPIGPTMDDALVMARDAGYI